MAVRRPIVRVGGRNQQLPPGDTLAGVVAAPAYPSNTHLIGIQASGSTAGYPAAAIGNQTWNILSSSVSGGGWLQSVSAAEAWVDVMLPIAVVIGDSIAEGHPALHGRLDAGGAGGYTPTYPDQAGQLSYEFSRLTGVRYFNHGIGSQTSTQILARFDRDAIGLTSDPGDGRGSKTLDRTPMAVVIVAGSNDIPSIPEETTKGNLLAMLNKAVAAKIIPIFLTLAPATQWTADQNAKIGRINAWMLQTLPTLGGQVFDLWAWGSNGSGGVKADRYVDNIHPTKAGYAQLAQDVLKSVNAALCMTSFRFDSKVDPANIPAGFSPPTNVRVTAGSVSVTPVAHADWFAVDATAFDWTQSAIVRITAGIRAGGVTGVNAGQALFEPVCTTAGNVAKAYGGMPCSALIYKDATGWHIDPVSRGAYAIAADSSSLKVTVDEFITAVTGWVGTAAVSNTLRVSARWGAPPKSVVEIVFGNGTSALDPTSAAVPAGVYITLVTVT